MNTQAAQLRPSIDRRDADDHGIYTDVDGDGDGTHIHFDSDGDGTHIDADVDGDGTHVDFDRNGDGAHIDGDGTHVDFDGDGDGTLIDVDGHGTHKYANGLGIHSNVDGDGDGDATHTDVDDNGTHKDVNGVCGTPVDFDGDVTHIDVDNHGTHTDVDGHDTHKDHKQLGRLPRGSTEDGSSLPSRVNAALPSRPWIAAAAILQSALEGTLSQKTAFNGELVEQNQVDDGLAQQTKLDARLAGQITVACRVLDQSTVVRGLAEQTTVDAKACSPRNYKRQPHEVEVGSMVGASNDGDSSPRITLPLQLDEVAIHLSIPSQCAVGNGSYNNDDGVNSVIGQLKSKAAHSLICSFSASSGQVVVDLCNMNTSFKSEEGAGISKNYEEDGQHLLLNAMVKIEDEDLDPPPAILVQEEEVQQLQTIAISEILKEEKDWNAQLGRNNLPEDEGQQLWKAVAKIVEKKFLNALRRLGGAEQVFLNLGPLLGARKVAGDGPEFLECTKTPVYEIGSFFLQACKRRTNVILLLLGALVLALGMWEKGTQKGWHDGFGILMALFLILSFTSVSRFRRARQMKKRLIEENGLQVEVIRSGQSHLVPICEIGEDMIVRLRKGSLVPADGLLVGGNSLVLDGILDKVISCDQNPFLYSGSKVIQGDGLMLVTSAGNATELGTAMSLVTDHADDKLLLEPRLRKHNLHANIKNLTKEALLEGRINKPIALVDDSALIISILLVGLILLLRSLIRRDINYDVSQQVKGEVGIKGVMDTLKVLLNSEGKVRILAAFLTAVVMGLQHGIPFVISGCLSYWNGRSRSSNITLNPKSLSACGTLGIVTVLCIDISGGILTSDRMEVNRFWIGEEDIADDHDDGHSEVSPVVLEALSRGVGAMGLVPGIPLTSADDALICWAKSKRGFKMELLEQRSTAVCDGKLSSNKEGNGVLLRNSDDDENILHLHWKGDAETILDLCSRYYECGGEIHAIEKQKSKFEKVTKEMEGSGLQPIAFAYKQTEVIELEENGLILLALVGVKQYYCLEEIKSVVRTFKNAGIIIKLVSQDDLPTSRAIARELGLFSPGSDDDGQTLKGHEFRELSDDVRAETADQITLLWSSLPTEKLLMVKSLKQRGHVVAFLGGLTARDAPVLKEADIGITTGNRSTQLAVEISDIDIGKSLTSLIPILASGKLAYRSIQKFVHIHVTSNLTILLTTAVESICLGETSITIFHLLYLNLILGIVGGFMLVTKPRNQQLGSIEPGKRNAWIITKAMWGNTLIQVLYQVAVLLMFQFKGEAVPGMKHINQKVRKAVIFFSFILYQVPSYFSPVPVPLIPETAKFYDLHNYRFVGVVGAFTVMQVVGATEFWVRLNWVHLAFCSLISLISWVIHLATVFLSLLIKRRAS